MIAKKGYGRAFLSRGSKAIFYELESKVPFPKGQKIPTKLAKGG